MSMSFHDGQVGGSYGWEGLVIVNDLEISYKVVGGSLWA
jgi:hypothetical protein